MTACQVTQVSSTASTQQPRRCVHPVQARNIVIATGGQASRIPIPGAEHAIISDEVGCCETHGKSTWPLP